MPIMCGVSSRCDTLPPPMIPPAHASEETIQHQIREAESSYLANTYVDTWYARPDETLRSQRSVPSRPGENGPGVPLGGERKATLGAG